MLFRSHSPYVHYKFYVFRRDRASTFFDYRRMVKPPKMPTSVLAKRLREAREAIGLPQDRLGVLIGLDESCSSARISRYEAGIHQPPLKTIERLAKELRVPMPYLFCEDDAMAFLILKLGRLSKKALLEELRNRNDD